MIPTLTLRPEYYCTTIPILVGFHVYDEDGIKVGVIPADDFYKAIRDNREYLNSADK